MRKIIILSLLTGLFAGELEVEGDLKVTGNIDSPTIDALSGMKPDRIYRYQTDGDQFSLIVPEGKIWRLNAISSNDSFGVQINGFNYYLVNYRGGQLDVIVMSGDILSHHSSANYSALLNIYEYSISGSGTDQGMDYIEP